MRGIDHFSANTGLIYDAALKPDAWPLVLKALCVELGADKAHLIYIGREDFFVSFSAGIGYNPVSLNISADKFKYCLSSDPVAKYGFSHPDEVFSDRRVIDPEVLHASAMQKEIRDLANMEYMLTTVMQDTSDEWSIINVHRSRDGKAFVAEDEEALQAYIPHLKRASYIHKKLKNSGTVNTVQATILDNLNAALIVVNEKHEVVVSNYAARKLLGSSRLLETRRGRFRCRAERENIHLSQAIEKALFSKKDNQSIMRVSAADKEDHLWVLASPLVSQGSKASVNTSAIPEEQYIADIPSRKFVLLTLCEPTGNKTEKSSVLKQLFGLTNAEADLARCLIEDKSLQEAADTLGRSVGTARVQLQTIFSKTNTNRQSSLIKLLMSIP